MLRNVVTLLLLLGLFSVVAPQEEQTCAADEHGSTCGAQKVGNDSVGESEMVVCSDYHESCAFWASLNPSECDVNPDYMRKNCPKSCKICKSGDTNAPQEEDNNHNDDDDYMDLGELQRKPKEFENEVETVMDMTMQYMKDEVYAKPSFASVAKQCKNHHTDCILWALQGACDEYPRYMLKNCAPTCQSCDQLAYEQRCPMTDDVLPPDAWQPGDLNKMFERITTHKDYAKFHPKVLSRPKRDEQEKDAPWIVTLDNFLSSQECERLIELGHAVGFERSWDVGEQHPDGSFDRKFSKDRTSTTAWCKGSCFEDAITKTVTDKIANLTRIPQENSEYLQLLKYHEGEFYKSHHDLNPFQAAHQPGVRMLTVFLYLNDVVQGGGTNFPKLDVTVEPKQGRVVLWPSVVDRNPSRKDGRTSHQALPVEKGIKYGANAWIHLRDFKGPLDNNCQ